MSHRLLGEADGFSLFGKLPSAGDFLRLNLAAAPAAALDGWLERGFAENADVMVDPERSPPTWRLALGAGAAGAQVMAGVMTPSRDAAGRPFPCLALAKGPDGIAEPPELAADAAWFDAVEEALVGAVASGAAARAVIAELDALGPLRSALEDAFVVKVRSLPDAALIDVRGGPDVRTDALGAAWAAVSPGPGASLWWRHEGARTLAVTAIGLPGGEAFTALFRTSVSSEAPPRLAALTG